MEIKDLSELLDIKPKFESQNEWNGIDSHSENTFKSFYDRRFPRAGDFPLENMVKVPGARKLSEVLFSQGLSDAHVYIPRKNIPVLKYSKIGVPICRATWNGVISPPFVVEIDKNIDEGSMFLSNEEGGLVRRMRVTRSFSMDRMMEHIFIRILPIRAMPPNLTGAGSFFRLFGEEPMHEGLILIAGKTGSGKSSLLASILQEYINKYPVHVLTIEDPIEYTLYEGLGYATQKEIGSDAPDYPTALRQAMRETPNIILVGEIRDQETAMSVLNAAETGHLVLGTIHAQGASGPSERILGLTNNVGTSNQRIAQTLKVSITVSSSPEEYTYSFTRITEAVRKLILEGQLQHWKNYAKEEEFRVLRRKSQ
ncbi:MAG: type IV pilus twitching motility protein PilT [Synergistaceae bacterium]|nr:type IV pilus twitching motility protein PilT [Synergistaceae bacterium]